jgi:hypothetical protein
MYGFNSYAAFHAIHYECHQKAFVNQDRGENRE